MKIDDKRTVTAWIPAVDILNTIIPLFKVNHFKGIRRIILLDKAYCKEPPQGGLARYIPINKRGEADIEIYFDYFDTLPESAKNSQLYLLYLITHILMHELYHHLVRGQHRIRKYSDKKEEMQAMRWAEGAVHHVFTKLYGEKECEYKLEQIRALLKS